MENTLNIGDGVTPDSTNTGTTGDALSFGTPSGSPTYVATSTNALEGQSLSISGAAGASQSIFWTGAADLASSGAIYFRMPASGGRPTSADFTFADWRNSSTGVWKILCTTGRLLRIQTGAGGGLKTFNSSAALPEGWYGALYACNLSSGAGADDELTVDIYDMTTGAAITDGHYAGTALTLSATGIQTMRMGKLDTAPVVSGFLIDRPAFNLGTLTTPTLWSPPTPPTGTTGYNRRVYNSATNDWR